MANQSYVEEWVMEVFDSFSVNKLPVDYGDIAMSRGQARQIVDRFTQEAVKKNITPQVFAEGLYYLGEVARSPDYTRSTIRNTLKNPIGRTLLENPGLIDDAVEQFGGLVENVNPELAGKHMGLVNQIMQEAKKDNLFRANVTHNEIKREIQQPMYGALQDWLKAQNKNNPGASNVLLKSMLGENATTLNPATGKPVRTKFDLPKIAVNFD